MGVPAFYRWLSEKYPKIVQDVLEERVQVAGHSSSIPLPFDATKPNPSGLECDNLYIDMNGIIHPCSHPENGPQPATEQEMYENVCHYVDRLFRAIRPRKLLYLAIDGVAPRAKMNQQRARRFRAAQEARELKELEEHVRQELTKVGQGQQVPPTKDAWDSNVITPGTPFMLELAEYIRFYIRKRISTDKAWKNIKVIFSDASIPGEGEHKIMSHIRLQRCQPGYYNNNPNTVHVLHGLDADLIMLALATHEPHFYISREEVLFGRRSQEQQEQRQLESGFRDKQRELDEAAGPNAMALPENNTGKPLQRISIPILREYLAAEFESCITPGPRGIPFTPSLERLIDDIVFLCFFVGNDFLPHLPSLDIRDGALDYLFNVYKRILPSLGDYMTRSGGNVNLVAVDVILAEVGAIEDYVFAMKHENEKREQERRKELRERKKRQRGGNNKSSLFDAPPPPVATATTSSRRPPNQRLGKAARILEKQEQQGVVVALSRGHQAKEEARHSKKAKHMMEEDNVKAAQALKASLLGLGAPKEEQEEESDVVKPKAAADAPVKEEVVVSSEVEESSASGLKRKHEEAEAEVLPDTAEPDDTLKTEESETAAVTMEPGVVGNMQDEFEDDAGDDDDNDVEEDEDMPTIDDIDEEVDPEAAKRFKERVKSAQQKKLDEYADNVEDNVKLYEAGWKDRYYSDKCKADDVSANGGREHLFRSYVMGLCWVMKYYYDGCPSWKWYYPFHYAPFASDLKNIERFQKDCRSFELSKPFNPVEQLMAVLPSDSSHAIPKASRWLMLDEESPIIDFYPRDVPVDPNGKAMPWLWVVLLPFIDEERLLAAMSPTMTKWTKEELLVNARGLDDGYLYINRSQPLSRKFSTVLEGGKKSAKSSKTRLTDAASYGSPGFSGSIRPPLSNEVYPVDEDAPILPPSSAGRMKSSTYDGIFAESIDNNEAVCVAFTEPLKLSHKSILLPGVKLPPPTLTADDKRIRRPRLNRGGGTIANLGTSSSNANGRSYQSGYGSMNIGSYERQLADRTGRSSQMYQAGTRSWGSMEPVPKRLRQGPAPAPQVQNPFMGQHRPSNGAPAQQWNNQGRRGGYHPTQSQSVRGPPQQGHPYQRQQQRQHQQQYPTGGHYQQQQYGGYQQQQQYGGHPQQRGGNTYQQQTDGRGHQQQQYRGGGYHQRPPPQYGNPQNMPHHQSTQQQGVNFRSFNQPSGSSYQRGQGTRPQQNPPRARASADVMDSLKAQLASTLKQNRRQG